MPFDWWHNWKNEHKFTSFLWNFGEQHACFFSVSRNSIEISFPSTSSPLQFILRKRNSNYVLRTLLSICIIVKRKEKWVKSRKINSTWLQLRIQRQTKQKKRKSKKKKKETKFEIRWQETSSKGNFLIQIINYQSGTMYWAG